MDMLTGHKGLVYHLDPSVKYTSTFSLFFFYLSPFVDQAVSDCPGEHW